MAVGTYTGQVVFAAGGVTSLTVPVTLVIAPPTATFFDNLPGQVSFFHHAQWTAAIPDATSSERWRGYAQLDSICHHLRRRKLADRVRYLRYSAIHNYSGHRTGEPSKRRYYGRRVCRSTAISKRRPGPVS
ncbi:MAG: hypothetical protein WDO73_06070 [Ignavibacteriota bacterium]